jgi:membrane-bound serine protease (ClpP class)
MRRGHECVLPQAFASEALSLHVIDVIADDVPDLLRKIDGRTVMVAGKPQQLATADLDVVAVPPNWRTELLTLVTNPNVAFILLLIGVYGLIFEFLNPGAVAPGLIGAISLLVALYALAFVPINYAGAALVLLGVVLMVAEAHIGAFGALGIGGDLVLAGRRRARKSQGRNLAGALGHSTGGRKSRQDRRPRRPRASR